MKDNKKPDPKKREWAINKACAFVLEVYVDALMLGYMPQANHDWFKLPGLTDTIGGRKTDAFYVMVIGELLGRKIPIEKCVEFCKPYCADFIDSFIENFGVNMVTMPHSN